MKYKNGKLVKTCPRCDSTNLGFTQAKIKEAFDDKKKCLDCNFEADFW